MRYGIKKLYLFQTKNIIVFCFVVLVSALSGISAIMEREGLGQICLKDYVITYNYRVTPYILFPVILFVIIIYLRKMHDDKIMIRYTDIRKFYFDMELNGMVCVLGYMTVTAVMVIAAGLVKCGFVTDNWDEPESMAKTVYGDYLVDSSASQLCVGFFAVLVLLAVINMNLIIVLHRFINNWIIEFFLCVTGNLYILTEGGSIISDHDWFITYSVYQQGWRYSFLAGLSLICIFTFIITLFVGKADCLGRNK